jgi:D-alanyl-D-alanine carboxypeptidase
LSYIDGKSPIFAPGTGYFYSNVNFLLLALIIDRVTGESHARTISQRILHPLGLNATYYKNEPGYPEPPGLVNSYQDLAGDGRLVNVSDLIIHSSSWSIGYSGLIASSADYAEFIEALLTGGIVDQASVAEMKEQTESIYYGLGLSFLHTPYGPGLGHSGGDFGAMSQVRYFPDREATLVLLSNGGDGGVPEELFDRLWDEAMQTSLGAL